MIAHIRGMNHLKIVIRSIKVKIYRGHLYRKVDSYSYGNILQGEVITASMFQKKSDLHTNFAQN